MLYSMVFNLVVVIPPRKYPLVIWYAFAICRCPPIAPWRTSWFALSKTYLNLVELLLERVVCNFSIVVYVSASTLMFFDFWLLILMRFLNAASIPDPVTKSSIANFVS